MKCVVKRQNATNRNTHCLCGIKVSDMSPEEIDANGRVKSPLSWFRLISCFDLDIARTFNDSSYVGFAKPEHFKLMINSLERAFQAYPKERKQLPSGVGKPYPTPVEPACDLTTETLPERPKGRKIKPPQIFDPTLQRNQDIQKSSTTQATKRKQSEPISKSSKKKKNSTNRRKKISCSHSHLLLRKRETVLLFTKW